MTLLLTLVALQLRYWRGDGGRVEVDALKQQLDTRQEQVDALQARNLALEAEVMDLKNGLEVIEEQARSQFGMIKEGEIFYQMRGQDEP